MLNQTQQQYTKKYKSEYKSIPTDRTTGRPISDRELELDVLYSLIMDGKNSYKINRLEPEDFYYDDTREIYLVFKDIVSSSNTADPTQLPARLKDKDCYLSLFNRSVLSSQLDTHIENLREVANLRKIADIAYRATVAANEGKKFVEIKSWVSSEFDKVKQAKGTGASQIAGLEDKYDEYIQAKEQPVVKTGYSKLDWVTGGFLNGSLNVIASAQGIGKTTFALNIVKHICSKLKKTVLYVSLEMSYLALYGKFVSLLSKMSFAEVMSGKIKTDNGWQEFDEWNWQNVHNGRAEVYGWKLYFAGEEETGTADIEAKIKEIGGIDIVFVDYLQLLKPSKSGSIYETTSATSRELKMLAMKYNIPFVVINSINRDYSNRSDYKPHISDLRNSGQLEFDADMVLLLHRPAMFREARNGENVNEFKHHAEVIIAKNRLGEANIEMDFYFDGTSGLFREVAKND